MASEAAMTETDSVQRADVRLRVNFTTREIDLAGPEESVRLIWEAMAELRSQFAEPLPKFADEAASDQEPGSLAELQQTAMVSLSDQVSPQEFGEYFYGFRSDISDVDRVLIAAAYVQQHSEDQSFRTGEAKQHLLNQGVKVANASEGVRRNLATKKAFALADTGKYRVSRIGAEHLASLKIDRQLQ